MKIIRAVAGCTTVCCFSGAWNCVGMRLCCQVCDEWWCAGYGEPDTRTGTVLVELRTANGVALVEYSCSARVVPLNSSSFCSTRCVHALS